MFVERPHPAAMTSSKTELSLQQLLSLQLPLNTRAALQALAASHLSQAHQYFLTWAARRVLGTSQTQPGRWWHLVESEELWDCWVLSSLCWKGEVKAGTFFFPWERRLGGSKWPSHAGGGRGGFLCPLQVGTMHRFF